MKRVFVFLFISCIAFTACNSHGDKITVKDDKGNKATIDVSDAKEAAKKVEENAGKAEELKKLTPLTIDQVKALIPNELMGMNRSSFSANSLPAPAVKMTRCARRTSPLPRTLTRRRQTRGNRRPQSRRLR